MKTGLGSQCKAKEGQLFAGKEWSNPNIKNL